MSDFRIPKKNRGGPARGKGGAGRRGGTGNGRGWGGHGAGGGSSFFNGQMKAIGTDRFCTACGNNIVGFAITMEGKCPHCQEKVPCIPTLEKEFDEHGWGRCRNCKSFLKRTMVYCQSCRCVNAVGRERVDRLKRQQLMTEKARMQKANEEKDAKIARLMAENEELNQVVGTQEKRLSERAQTGLGDMDDMEGDEVLSQFDEATVASTKTAANVGTGGASTTTGSNENERTTTGSSEGSSEEIKSPEAV